MKIIKPNQIAIEELTNAEFTNARESIKELIKIEDKYVQYVKCEKDGQIIKSSMHPFAEAVHQAFGSHLPLVISPDMIWYLISSATASHINLHPEELRDKFVDFKGKQTINIRRDDFQLGSLSNPWHEVIDDFCAEIGKLTKNDIADKLVADFSTTTKDARVVSQIVLMDSMQKYFDFKFSTMCGIPEIRLNGNKQDWQKLKEKAHKILELIPEFKKWFESLDGILQEFINVFDDKIDNNFWNSIYKIDGGSGGPYITGWIIALFPYLDGNRLNHYVWESNWKDAKGCFSGLTTSDFDYHMNQVPFTWEYFSQEIKMLFIGGLVGVLYEKDKSLQPVFGYAVTEAQTKSKPDNFPNFE